MKTNVRDGIITSSIVIMALGLIGAIIPIDVSATNGGDAPVKVIIHNDFKDPNKKIILIESQISIIASFVFLSILTRYITKKWSSKRCHCNLRKY